MRRVPDLLENYVQRAKGLLQDRNHGVLLTGITLITEMCQIDESCLDEYRKVGSVSAHRVELMAGNVVFRLYQRLCATLNNLFQRAIVQSTTCLVSRTPSSKPRSCDFSGYLVKGTWKPVRQ